VYLAAERKNKDEIQGSFTPFRMTTSKGSQRERRMTTSSGSQREGRKIASQERKVTTSEVAAALLRLRRILLERSRF
jgi:hypothetical protein